MIPAGKRKNYLAIEYDAGASGAQNADGHTTPNWVKRFNAWGAIETPLTAAKEVWNAYHMDATVTHIVTIPFTTQAILTTDRVTYGSRVFNLAGPPIDPNEMHAELVLLVNEEVAV